MCGVGRKKMRRILISTICGAAIGFLMYLTVNAGFVRCNDSLFRIVFAVHAPAWLLSEAWIRVGLPDDGDAFGFLIFSRAVVVQWVLLGLVVGALLAWRKRRRNAQQAAGPNAQ